MAIMHEIALSYLDFFTTLLESVLFSKTFFFFCIGFASLFGPHFLGWLLTTTLRKTVLNDYPLSFGAIHISVYYNSIPYEKEMISHCWRLNVRVENFVFGNPPPTATSPSFDHGSYFLAIGQVKFTLAVDPTTIGRAFKRGMTSLWRALRRNSVDNRLAKQVKNSIVAPEVLGEVVFSDISFNKVDLNFTLSERGPSTLWAEVPPSFNINGLTAAIAEGAVRSRLRKGKLLPNCLDITVVRGRNLRAMDTHSGQKSSDPYVRMRARHEKRYTTTAMRNLNPMWNEHFSLHAPDASTVLLVEVMDEDLVSSEKIGSWIMTLKWLVCDPTHCKHNTKDGLQVSQDADGYPIVRGWFKLSDSVGDTEDESGNLTCGELELILNWRYSANMAATRRLPAMTAMDQMAMNSVETRLRLGNIDRVIRRLECFPLRFRVLRATLRDISIDIRDIFAGFEAHHPLKACLIKAAGDQGMTFTEGDGIRIGVLYVTKALKGSLDLWQVLKRFSIAVLEEATARGIFSAGSQSFWGLFHSLENRWYHMTHRKTSRNISRVASRRISEHDNFTTQNGNDQHSHCYHSSVGFALREWQHLKIWNKRVLRITEERKMHSTDESFLKPSNKVGFILRACDGGQRYHFFKPFRIELKEETLFFHPADPHGNMKRTRSTWKKISIRNLRYIWVDSNCTLILQGKYAVDYFRSLPSKSSKSKQGSRKSREDNMRDNPQIDEWFEAIFRVFSESISRHEDGAAATIAHVISRCDLDETKISSYKRLFTAKGFLELADLLQHSPSQLAIDFDMPRRDAIMIVEAAQRFAEAKKKISKSQHSSV